MAGRYLTDLADVCRGAGLTVLEQDGWQTRARSSGGYATGRPDHVMVHHTASGPASNGWPDCDFMSFTSDIRPVTNLYLDRAGWVYVLGAGATNTNGAGADPCGIVAADDMNTHAIGIEGANDGVGEPWPTEQQDAYVVLVAALCAAYSIDPARIHAHFEWAPTRKIDPAGPSRWSPQPSGGGGGNMWNLDAFRGDVAAPPGDDHMPTEIKLIASDHTTFVWNPPGNTLRWVSDGNVDALQPATAFAAVYSGTIPNASSVDDAIRSLLTNTDQTGRAPNAGLFVNAW